MCNSVSGVVRMVEFFEQEHEWIIIMSKLSNCMDLFDYLESKQRGRLSENEACHFFRQLVRINMDLFHQGVCHRDLKSDNLLADLGYLVGIDSLALQDNDNYETLRVFDRLVFIQIGRSDRYSSGINLNWSEDQHFVVHIDIGTHVAL
jgi:serine/threonine protein kinase